jgi:hypothetical protein
MKKSPLPFEGDGAVHQFSWSCCALLPVILALADRTMYSLQLCFQNIGTSVRSVNTLSHKPHVCGLFAVCLRFICVFVREMRRNTFCSMR